MPPKFGKVAKSLITLAKPKLAKNLKDLKKSHKAIISVVKNPRNPDLKTYDQLKAGRESWKNYLPDYDDAGKKIMSAKRRAEIRAAKVKKTGDKLKTSLNKKTSKTAKTAPKKYKF